MYACAHVRADISHDMRVEVREQLVELNTLSFYDLGPRNQTQVLKLGRKSLYRAK